MIDARSDEFIKYSNRLSLTDQLHDPHHFHDALQYVVTRPRLLRDLASVEKLSIFRRLCAGKSIIAQDVVD